MTAILCCFEYFFVAFSFRLIALLPFFNFRVLIVFVGKFSSSRRVSWRTPNTRERGREVFCRFFLHSHFSEHHTWSRAIMSEHQESDFFQQKRYLYRESQDTLLQSFVQVNIMLDRARSWVKIRKVTFSTKTLHLQGNSGHTFTVFRSSEHHAWSRAIMSEHQESDFFNKSVTFTG